MSKKQENLRARQLALRSRNLLLGDGYRDGLVMKVVVYSLMILISFVYLQPLIEMFLTSLMGVEDFINPEVILIARNPQPLENYGHALNFMDYWTNLAHSFFFSFSIALVQTFVSALAGYSLARYKIVGHKFWFGVLLVTFIVPLQVLTASRVVLLNVFQKTTGIIVMETFIPQFVLALLGQGVNSTILILICYSFFKEIPIALDEASVMDGATPFQTFYHIIVKLSASVVLTVFLFSFVWNWNDTFSSGYYNKAFSILPTQINGDENYTNLVRTGAISEGVDYAKIIASILPLIILYLFVQKRFVQGIEQTGMTGQ